MIKTSANALSLQRHPAENGLSYATTAMGRGAVGYAAASGGASALEFLARLAADLSRGQVELPCFPNIVVKIRDALLNPRTTTEQTVKLVGSEPRLAARLIQTANSAALNPTGKYKPDDLDSYVVHDLVLIGPPAVAPLQSELASKNAVAQGVAKKALAQLQKR